MEARDRRLVLACTVISVVSLFVGVRYYFLAFPEASIEFRVTRESSAPVAESFLRALGLDPSGYRHAAVFDFDDEQKTFLEREVGVAESNRLLETTVRLWRWRHRWFRPLQKEEMSVAVTTAGGVVELSHLLPEETPGADLTQERAREIAERFLARTMARPPDTLAFVEAATEKRAHRSDHAFTWKLRDFEVRGADYRIRVSVAGDRVSGYRESLEVPDTWRRDYAKLRSKNEITGQVDSVLLLLTLLAMGVFLVLRIRRGDVRWKPAISLGGLIFVLLSLSQLNSLPGALHDYDTTSSFGGFLLTRVLGALGVGFGGGVVVFVLTAAAEPFYRERFPKFLSLTSLLRPRAVRSREFFVNCLVGITLTCFFFAYENVFYLIANSMGAWAPREVAYSELLSTAFPWVYVLFFGFLPAISEEFISRMFSIPFLERAFRSTALAVVVSAFIWGFGHAGYPNQPFWIRGLEVGIAGIVFGLVFLRFGIASVLICHFSVDALYTAFVLIRSPNLYYRVSGTLSAGIFGVLLLVAIVAYFRRGGFAPAEVANEVEGVAPPVTPEAGLPPPAISTYRPLSRRATSVALLAAAALATLALVPVPSFGDWVSFRSDRDGAREAAEAFLDRSGFDVGAYRSAVEILDRTDRSAAVYLREHGGLDAAARVYRDSAPTPLWRVRFFVPGQKEEFRVSVNANDGRVVGFSRSVLDGAPGATLSKEEALAVARTFLSDRGIDPDAGQLREQVAKDEAARRDHTLVWEFPERSAGEAGIRHEVVVQGGSVGSWLREVRIPEDWRRARESRTAVTVALRLLKFPVFLAIGALALVLLIAKIRAGEIPWRSSFLVGGTAAVAGLVRTSLSLDPFWNAYDTSIPAAGYWVVILVGALLGTVLFFAAGMLVGAGAGALVPSAIGMLRSDRRSALARDALVAAAVAAGLAVGLPALLDLLGAAIPSGVIPDGVSWPTGIDSAVPAAVLLANAVSAAIFFAGLAAIAAAVLGRFVPAASPRVAIALLLVVALLPAGARRPAEWLLGAVAAAVVVAALWAFARFCLRDNPLAWLAAAFLGPGIVTAARTASQPRGSLQVQGFIALVALAVVVAVLVRDAIRRPTPP